MKKLFVTLLALTALCSAAASTNVNPETNANVAGPKALSEAGHNLADEIAATESAVPLKVLLGGEQSSSRRTFTVVCQTDPEATASINGQELHVYRTGTFGRTVDLLQGPNTITIRVNLNGETATRTLNVNYIPSKSSPKTAAKPVLKPMDSYGVTSPRSPLLYSTGTDRLGGSKMGYLCEGIALKITGSIGDLYKVQLSENRYAYMEKHYITLSDAVQTAPDNSGSIHVVNRGSHDVLTMSLPQTHAWCSTVEMGPTKICVDLFGVMNNSNWITQQLDLEIIDYVECRQVDSDIMRIEMGLKTSHCWGYSVKYEGTTLRIDVKHAPKEYSLEGMLIGLDPGHGGTNRGAVSLTGVLEKDINLSICKRVKALLEARGAKVVMTRENDMTMSMDERKDLLEEAGVDMLLSIHNNAGGSAIKPMGTSCYYKHIQNRELAECILKRLAGMPDVPNYGLTGNFNFALGMPTEYPTMLVEGLFVSSMPDEEKLLMDDSQQDMAERIVAGVEDYLEAVRQNP